MQYIEKIETVILSEQLYHKSQTLPFVLLTTKTGSGKTFVSIRAAYLIDPNAQLWVFMPKAKKLEGGWDHTLAAFNEAHPDSNLTLKMYTYSQLTSESGVKTLQADLKTATDNNQPIILLYDEAHLLKTSTAATVSKRAKAAMDLNFHPQIINVIGITATPTPNSYLDACNYFIMAGFYKNKNQFIKAHVKFFNDYHAPIVKDPYTKQPDDKLWRDVDVIKDHIHHMTVYMDTDHLLPPVETQHVKVPVDNVTLYQDKVLTEEFCLNAKKTRRDWYRRVFSLYRQGYLESAVSALNHQQRILALDPNRMVAILNILKYNEDHDPHPTLIFYHRTLHMEYIKAMIHEHLPNYNVQIVNGKIKEVAQPENPNTAILIQYTAGSAAIEFPTSKTSIFAAPTYNYQDYVQAIGRNVRANSTQTVKHYILSAEKTVEEDIWNVIGNKGSFNKTMINNFYHVNQE